MQTDFMTPEEVIAALRREFPAFAVPESVEIAQPRLDSPNLKVVINLASASLTCQCDSFGWSLRLMNRSIVRENANYDPAEVDVLVSQKETLGDAFSALRQATAEQMQALGLVAPAGLKRAKKWGEGDWANEDN